MNEIKLRLLIRENILEAVNSDTSAPKTYTDVAGYKFQIQNGKLMLIARPAGITGKNSLPFEIPSLKLQASLDSLISKYKNDPELKSLSKSSISSQQTQPQSVGQSDLKGVSMYGAKVGNDKDYTEYRVYSNGLIKRFGVMKAGQWKMDDPAKEIPADKRVAVAQNILKANQYDSAAKASLDKLASGQAEVKPGSGDIFQSILSTIRKAFLAAGAPVHYIAFADYLLGRTSTFTESDLSAKYQTDLAKVAKYALTRTSPRSGKKGEILHSDQFVYGDFWLNASKKLGQGTPGTPLNSQGVKGTGTVEDLEFFLGGMAVTQEGQNYVIRDIYDFDDYYVSPKAYDEMSEFLGVVAKAKSFYSTIRNAAAFRQSSGYKGFSIEIALPSSLAADFKV